ncbi:EAL domain-containing protein [Brucella anthropi]|jgi:EAL domain-containing protein (putative c-di-GMP-specific phosphodiesterase class I)|uniref:EAL domain-containing protein n=1 Tax=Brucella anthropi TaxID=529 RepID=UPI000E909508|nr:EAL domain-containing protein [Ochrobactrum sp. MT180101]HBQ32847.1 EAL domain-containing protein [Brucella anthropi]
MDHLDVADPSLLSAITDAILENRIEIAVQGIHCVTNADRLLYGECLARLLNRDGTITSAGEFIPILDIWGKTPLLDQHMIKLVLDELDTDSRAVLGCNISTDSLTDAEWSLIYRQLVERAHLVHRLVLEITETRPLSDIMTANRCLAAARKLGCLIAVDDFGSGQVTPWQLLRLEVDIVKIDASFVRDIKESHPRGNSLQFMIGLAKCAAPTVIVEGVETNTHLIDAVMAGATHAQGYHLSRPVFLHSNEPVFRANSEGKTCH